MVYVIIVRHLALAAPLALIIVLSVVQPAFAQEDDDNNLTEPRGALKSNATEGSLLNATRSDEPVLEQTSEKGIYLVEIRWPQDPVSVFQRILQIEIAFLNASSPRPTAENFPQTETNTTGQSTPGASGFTDPRMIETTLPVESYDIAIYAADDGRELWKKMDQPGLGGRGTQRIDLEGNYTGPVTINITDIRPGWSAGGTTTAEELTDSVSFTATIVPEFSIAASLILAGSVAAGIAAARLRKI